ncbi:MAG: glutamate-5-semialdehyde dehydrogenase [Planctomycetota bacterium]|jgi:glutamate-5-semialdehyde dehydrogenase
MSSEGRDLSSYATSLVENARRAAADLVLATAASKDAALRAAAAAVRKNGDTLRKENEKDLAAGRAVGLSPALLDRLELTEKRIEGMAAGFERVAALKDPVGEIISGWSRPNGLRIRKVRVPLGVILMIYEARPNVTADAAALTIKSGNSVILRGGKEAVHSNLAIGGLIRGAVEEAGLPGGAVQMVETTERALVGKLLSMTGRIDLVIPRGGKGLIKRVVEESRIPVVKHYEGVCHTFVDATADLEMAREICFNAKVQRPSVCNAMETLLVHEEVAADFLPLMCKRFREANVELRGDEAARAYFPDMKEAAEEDWSTEYLDLILSIKVVKGVDEAIEHISTYGSAHSDAIVSSDLGSVEEFTTRVDSSAVFVNTSTRFNDGEQFGFGAEMGISTDKLHARGPMALEELTSYKYMVYGEGQLRE